MIVCFKFARVIWQGDSQQIQHLGKGSTREARIGDKPNGNTIFHLLLENVREALGRKYKERQINGVLGPTEVSGQPLQPIVCIALAVRWEKYFDAIAADIDDRGTAAVFFEPELTVFFPPWTITLELHEFSAEHSGQITAFNAQQMIHIAPGVWCIGVAMEP